MRLSRVSDKIREQQTQPFGHLLRADLEDTAAVKGLQGESAENLGTIAKKTTVLHAIKGAK